MSGETRATIPSPAKVADFISTRNLSPDDALRILGVYSELSSVRAIAEVVGGKFPSDDERVFIRDRYGWRVFPSQERMLHAIRVGDIYTRYHTLPDALKAWKNEACDHPDKRCLDDCPDYRKCELPEGAMR